MRIQVFMRVQRKETHPQRTSTSRQDRAYADVQARRLLPARAHAYRFAWHSHTQACRCAAESVLTSRTRPVASVSCTPAHMSAIPNCTLFCVLTCDSCCLKVIAIGRVMFNGSLTHFACLVTCKISLHYTPTPPAQLVAAAAALRISHIQLMSVNQDVTKFASLRPRP